MNFLIPTGVDLSGRLAINPGDKDGYSNPMRFEHSDRAYVGKKCFGSNGFTRFMEFIDGERPNEYFTLVTNNNNYLEFRCLDDVALTRNAQLVAYIGIQPKCDVNRQVTFDFKGLFSAFAANTQLMVWRNIHYVGGYGNLPGQDGKQYFWQVQRFDQVNAKSIGTGNEFIWPRTIFSSLYYAIDEERQNFPQDYDEQQEEWRTINYTQENEQGIELTATTTVELEPRACPHMFALTATNDETANLPGGYIEAKITLDG
jgi:hypothetical protein